MSQISKATLVEIKKPNLIISAMSSNSLISHKLFLLALQRARKLDENSNSNAAELKRLPTILDYSKGLVAEFTFAECRRIMGISKGGSQTAALANYINNNLATDWVLRLTDRRFKEKVQLISGSLADIKTKKIYIKFSDDESIQKLLFYCKNNYTLEKIETFMSFKSIFSFRLYELALEMLGKSKSASNPKPTGVSFIIGTAELKFKLGLYNGVDNGGTHKATKAEEAKAAAFLAECPPNYIMAEKMYKTKVYSGYTHLADRVLSVAQREIEAYTPFHFDFKPIVEGNNKPVEVKIILAGKEAAVPALEQNAVYTAEQETVINQIFGLFDKKYGLTLSDAATLASKADFDITKIESTYRTMTQTTNVNSVMGFMIRGIEKGGYQPSTTARNFTKIESGTKFNNFQQRVIDFEALERSLITG